MGSYVDPIMEQDELSIRPPKWKKWTYSTILKTFVFLMLTNNGFVK